MNLSIGDTVSFSHFPADRLVVLYFNRDGICWAETFHDWDWYGMRRAIRRNAIDEEEMHVELIELAKLERQLQTRSISSLIEESERQTAYLWRGIPMAMLGMGVIVFWVLAAIGTARVFGW